MNERMNELFKSSNEEVMELSLSYSRLSDFDRNGPRALLQRSLVSGDGVRIGSLVDDLSFDEESFDEKYHLFNGVKPTATTGKLCDIILNNYKKIPDKENILEIIKNNKFWSRQKEESLINHFDNDEFYGYIDAQLKSKSKTLITTADLALANELKDILFSHEYSKDIMTNDLENHDQFKFTINYKSFRFRGIIDKLVIDHKNKTVKIIDLKTGKNKASEFQNSFIKWRYYFQESIYMKSFKFICEKFNLKGYKLLPFEFLYISTSEKIPFIFQVTKKWHKAAIQGFETNSGYKYRGLDELLDNIKWHLTTRVFDMSKDIYESKGNILINDDFIKLIK